MLTPQPVEIPANARLIDVRSAGEFANGHIEGAINLPLDSIASQIKKVCDKIDEPLVLYCQSGMRSSLARQQLMSQGYQQVVNGGGVGSLALRLQKQIIR
ncbi:rhodanese-like domain-containing protein [Leeia sp. TBRC 13508]|uniref:Rhodanese-like domain-containing protein n=1 Tax=Leeia speluncae TaxID=2884804 RepID=A0ABS8D9N3_9NEIS|nr:rhodanese-like domain-containing protein [Leeia speluncae]MCB6184926.1 rhodanese-like domain-containing protein [Leeia speluncae]